MKLLQTVKDRETYNERLPLIKHILACDANFFDDMFELAESEGFLKRCELCNQYKIPELLIWSELEEQDLCVECSEGLEEAV